MMVLKTATFPSVPVPTPLFACLSIWATKMDSGVVFRFKCLHKLRPCWREASAVPTVRRKVLNKPVGMRKSFSIVRGMFPDARTKHPWLLFDQSRPG